MKKKNLLNIMFKKIFLAIFIFFDFVQVFSQNIETVIQGGQQKLIVDVAFSDSLHFVAAISENNTLIVWDLAKELQIVNTNIDVKGTLYFINDYNILIVTPNNEKYIFYIVENKLDKFDTYINYEYKLSHTNFVNEEDNEYVEIKNFKLQKYKFVNDKKKTIFKRTTKLHDYYYKVMDCSVSHNLIIASDQSGKVYTYKYNNGRFIKYLYKHKHINIIRFSEDNTFFAIVDNENNIDIWNTSKLEHLKTLKTNVIPKTKLIVNNKDNNIIFGDVNGDIFRFNYKETPELQNISILEDKIIGLEIADDNSIIAAANSNSIKKYDYKNNQIVFSKKIFKRKSTKIEAIDFNYKYNYLACVGDKSRIVELNNFNITKFASRKLETVKITDYETILVDNWLDIAKEYRFIDFPKTKLLKTHQGAVREEEVTTTSTDAMGGVSVSSTTYYYPLYGKVKDFLVINENDIFFCTQNVIGHRISGYDMLCYVNAHLVFADNKKKKIFCAVDTKIAKFDFDKLYYEGNDIFVVDYFKLDAKEFKHTETINDYYLYKNNKLLITCSDDGSVKFWNNEKDERIFTLLADKDGYLIVDKDGYFTGDEQCFYKIAVREENQIYNADKNSKFYLSTQDFFNKNKIHF